MTHRSWNISLPQGPTGKGRYISSGSQAGSNSPHFPDVLINNSYDSWGLQSFNPELTRGGTSRTGQAANPPLLDIRVVSDDIAVSRLAEKWTQSDLNLGVAIAEGRESAAMIANSAITLAKMANAVRRKDMRQLASLATFSRSQRKGILNRFSNSDVGGAWLQARYGWLPLLSDIYAAADLLKPKPIVTKVRASHGNSLSQQVDRNYFYERQVGRQMSTSRAGAYAHLSRTPSWSERLGLTDPASIAWELVPYSFVADWLVPIGDTIKANYVRTRMPVTKSGLSRVTRTSFYGTAISRYAANIAPKQGPLYRSSYSAKRFIGLGGLDFDGLTAKMQSKPVWDRDLKRVVDTVAMSISDLRKTLR